MKKKFIIIFTLLTAQLHASTEINCVSLFDENAIISTKQPDFQHWGDAFPGEVRDLAKKLHWYSNLSTVSRFFLDQKIKGEVLVFYNWFNLITLPSNAGKVSGQVISVKEIVEESDPELSQVLNSEEGRKYMEFIHEYIWSTNKSEAILYFKLGTSGIKRLLDSKN